jgi:hypothetical protein
MSCPFRAQIRHPVERQVVGAPLLALLQEIPSELEGSIFHEPNAEMISHHFLICFQAVLYQQS